MVLEYLQHPTARRFARFVAVGVLNTAFGYGIFAVAVLLGAGAQLALVLQFGFGTIWNYMMHARLVFAARGHRRLPLYIAAYCSIYVLNAALLRLALAAGMDALIAQAMILPFIVVVSFLLISRVLRPDEHGTAEPAAPGTAR